MAKDLDWMRERQEKLVSSGLNWDPPTLEPANAPRVSIDGKESIMLSANNYLNLSTHPKVVEASIEARKYGAGSGSVRAIAGTMDIHLEAERVAADFKGVEAALIYSAGYTANVGLIPTLVKGKDDLIISDELNHGSIIDGVRLTKAQRAVYPHNDVGLSNVSFKRITDMIVNSSSPMVCSAWMATLLHWMRLLQSLKSMMQWYSLMTVMEKGILGDGRGIVAHFGLQGRVDFEVGSYQKQWGCKGAFSQEHLRHVNML